MNGLRLLLFIVNKQAALLVNKLDAQMAAFQQLPGRGRQATVRREMDLAPSLSVWFALSHASVMKSFIGIAS